MGAGSTQEAATARARFVAGDPLRAVAALSVVAFHVTLAAIVLTTRERDPGTLFSDAYGPVLGAVFLNAHLGLYLFFVLSGYLLSRPFVRALAAGEPLPRLSAYARNRLLRIVPAFWVVVALSLLRFGPRDSDLLDVLAVPAFLQNVRPSAFSNTLQQAWTLDIEMAFYLLLPIAGALLVPALRGLRPGSPRLVAIVALAVAAFAGSVLLRGSGEYTNDNRANVAEMLFAFMPGIALAALEPLAIGSAWLRRSASYVVPALLAGFVLLAIAYAGTDPLAVTTKAALAGLTAGALVAATLAWQWSGRRAWRILDNRAMRWLGVRSYGIYLVHAGIVQTILPLLDGYGGARWIAALGLVTVIPACLLAAALLYRYVEAPVLAWRTSRPVAAGHAGGVPARLPAPALPV